MKGNIYPIRLSPSSCILSLLLCGCTAVSNFSDTAETLSPTTITVTYAPPKESATFAPDLKRTDSAQTATPTATPVLEPSLSANILFSNPLGCTLPCWNDLIPGQSGRNEMRVVYQQVFGLDQSFFPDQPSKSPDEDFLPDGIAASSYVWYMSADFSETFGVSALYNLEDYRLRSLFFHSTFPHFNHSLTPQRVLLELGTPSQFLISVGGTERADIAHVKLRMVYEQGMVFLIETLTPASFSTTDNKFQGSIELCLGGNTWDNGDRKIFLVEHMDNGVQNLSPIQTAAVTGFGFDQDKMTEFEDFFNTTLAAISQLAKDNDNPCLMADFTK